MVGQQNWENKFRGFDLEKRLLDLARWLRSFFAKQSQTVRYAIYATGAAFLALLLAGGWYWYDKGYEENAWKLYNNIQYTLAKKPELQTQDIQEAFKGFISQYPRSQAASIANYNLGNLYHLQNNAEGEIAVYNVFLKQAGDENELATIAGIARGYAYEANGEYEKAMDSYQNAAKTKNGIHFASINLQNIARMYEVKGDTKAALEHYEKALVITHDQLVARIIKNKIANLLNG